MRQACRNALRGVARERAEHAGLLLASYLLTDEREERPQEPPVDYKVELLNQARAACGRAGEVYRPAYARWEKALPTGTVKSKVRTLGRFVTGLGGASAIEAGIRLHHTYGVPVIPGSGLKGLAAHYCHMVWGETDQEFRVGGKHHKVLFGDTETAGLVVFQDAWLLPEDLAGDRKGLLRDVMTPHHQDYNLAGGEAPTDFDKPVPVPFLSVGGRFLVALSPAGGGAGTAAWMKLAMKAVKEALRAWGAGGKTRSGYGRFEPVGQDEVVG